MKKPCKHEFTGHLRAHRGGSRGGVVVDVAFVPVADVVVCRFVMCHCQCSWELKNPANEFTGHLRGRHDGSEVAWLLMWHCACYMPCVSLLHVAARGKPR